MSSDKTSGEATRPRAAGMSREVQELHDRLKPGAEARFGRNWKAVLAKTARMRVKTLKTLFYRGQQLPREAVIRELERAAGVAPPPPEQLIVPVPDDVIADLSVLFGDSLEYDYKVRQLGKGAQEEWAEKIRELHQETTAELRTFVAALVRRVEKRADDLREKLIAQDKLRRRK
jgi:hypothetical protein